MNVHGAKVLPVTEEAIEAWARDGWVDLRLANCRRWVGRLAAIHREVEGIPEDDSSGEHLRNRRFWDEEHRIQPGKVVGWILSEEEHGARLKS